MTEKEDATDLVYELLEGCCAGETLAETKYTVALQGGKIYLDGGRKLIEIDVKYADR